LIESIDNLDRALGAVPADKVASQSEANKDLYDLYHGLRMTETVIMNTLKKHGLERFDAADLTEDGKRQKFDPNRHEATFMTKAEGLEDGDIMDAQTKGFILNGRVLRVSSSISIAPILFLLQKLKKFSYIGRQGWCGQELMIVKDH
jgi:molecular chaperone GrpE